jgi:hypothetical protein
MIIFVKMFAKVVQKFPFPQKSPNSFSVRESFCKSALHFLQKQQIISSATCVCSCPSKFFAESFRKNLGKNKYFRENLPKSSHQNIFTKNGLAHVAEPDSGSAPGSGDEFWSCRRLLKDIVQPKKRGV